MEPSEGNFAGKSLQMVSFTITEKGYALQKADGTWFPFVEADIKNGPDKATGAMAVLVAMLLTRYKSRKISDCSRFPRTTAPRTVQNCRICSDYGREWKKAGFVDWPFMAYVSDEKTVAFPWTMIDKITPSEVSRSQQIWKHLV